MQVASVAPTPSSIGLSAFLERYRETLKTVFHRRADINTLGLRRGLPPFIMREIRACDPLTVWIPKEYGGRGGRVHECLSMLAVSSYESLALSLTFGINGALFLQPLAKYGNDAIKADVFARFVREKNMGGLMITEPDYGSDALSMQTSFVELDGGYHIQGTKHWGGLTGWADFWLVTARPRGENDQLGRDIHFFVCDMNQPEQHIEVEEFYENLGLYMIPYGLNKIDIQVPETHRLEPETTGIKMMLDILHRSRIQFPGMAMGFLQRMLDEGLTHCKERFVGGRSLFTYDQVKERLARLQAFYTTCSAMCTYTSEQASIHKDLAKESVPANAIKTVATDFMQEASQSLLQLTGGKGYRLDHIAGRSVVDSRPFQIFEGSNDILYQQISESVLKLMRSLKENNLYAFLKNYELTARASEHFKDLLDFDVDPKMPQRKLVDLGQALSRIISMEMTIDLGERGFRSELISSCLSVLQQDVKSIICRYRDAALAAVTDDYEPESSWLNFLKLA